MERRGQRRAGYLGVARGKGSCRLLQPDDVELVGDALVDEQPRSGDAGLSRGREDPGDHAVDDIVDAHVVEEDVGALAAQLENQWLEVLSGTGRHESRAVWASGEPHLSHQGMRDERVARATGYSERRLYLRRDNLFVSRIDYFDRQGRLAKRQTFRDPRPDASGAWRAGMILAKIATKKIEVPGMPVLENPAVIAPSIDAAS